MTGEPIWTVEARAPIVGDDSITWSQEWTVWTAWVDRATAEAEKEHAKEEGFYARNVRAS